MFMSEIYAMKQGNRVKPVVLAKYVSQKDWAQGFCVSKVCWSFSWINFQRAHNSVVFLYWLKRKHGFDVAQTV
jgi:hypothetical protein